MTQTRKQHWETVYHDKSPLEVSWYQSEPRLSLDLIAACAVGPDARIIDVGGGASTLVDHLLDLGYHNLSVLDISASALEHARGRLGAKAESVQWLETDITEFTPEQPFDVWHDRAVFHFLTEAKDRERYREVLERGVVPGGQVIMAAFAPDGPTQCSGLPICRYDAKGLLRELGTAFELLEERREVHVTPAQKEQSFAFFRLQRI